MKKLIKSSNIFCDNLSDPFSGYILIQDEEIHQLIPEKSFDPKLFESIEILDFQNSFIMPGIIDTNVHLNSNYDKEWSDPDNITKMASQGGITTIIENPLLCNYNESFDEMEALQRKIQNLDGHLHVDCGLLALLSAHNIHKIDELWSSGLILGFKLYLSLNLQHDIPQINPIRHLKKIRDCLMRSKHSDFFLSIHPELASNRDFFLCSPLRGFPKEKRLDLNEEIKDSGYN